MRKITFTYNNRHFERISKTRARRVWREGGTIALLPCLANPESPWNSPYIIDRARAESEGETFETVVNAFECYNCGYAELGKYAAFYEEV